MELLAAVYSDQLRQLVGVGFGATLTRSGDLELRMARHKEPRIPDHLLAGARHQVGFAGQLATGEDGPGGETMAAGHFGYRHACPKRLCYDPETVLEVPAPPWSAP
jgi:hypothetical protein